MASRAVHFQSIQTPGSGPTNIPPPLPPYPAGAWGSQSTYTSTTLAPNFVTNTGLVGCLVQQQWKDMEGPQGNYKLANLVKLVKSCAANGVWVKVNIDASILHCPTYVTNGAVNTATWTQDNTGITNPPYGSLITTPVYWDSFYRARLKAFYTAVADALAGISYVVGVSIPWYCISSQDSGVPHSSGTINGVPYNNQTAWLAAGYNHTLMVNTAYGILNDIAPSFPNTVFLLAPLQSTSAVLDGHVAQLPNDLMALAPAAYGNQFICQCDDFTNVTQSVATAQTLTVNQYFYMQTLLYNNRANSVWQMEFPFVNDPTTGYPMNGGVVQDPVTTMAQAMTKAETWGVTTVEFLEKDSTITAYNANFLAATLALGGTHR